jgi:hypothetical protein
MRRCRIIRCKSWRTKDAVYSQCWGVFNHSCVSKKFCVALDNVGLSPGVEPNHCRPVFKSRKREISTKEGHAAK